MNKVKDLNYDVNRSKLKKGSKEIIQLDATFNEMMRRIRYLADKLLQEQENQRKSELKALQNQINPHFLYNTLDSIIYMIDKGENQKAEFKELHFCYEGRLAKGKFLMTEPDIYE